MTYDITTGMDAGCTAQTTTDPKGNVTQKIYDRVGRISQVIADGMTTVYHYNDNGSVQSVIYSDGSREDYTYTSDNHLDTLTNTKADATVIDSYSYTYDAAHNMLSKVDARGTTAYTYDSLNRLLTVTEPSGKTTGYTYDASGNRLTETDTLGSDITVITYTYDFQNRLTGTVTTLAESTVVTGDEGTAAITTIGTAAITSTVAYTYDNNGNQLSKTTTDYVEGVAQTEVVDQANTYDLFNQLIVTVTSAGVIVINTYNGDGLRVGKSVNGELTRYLYEYQKVVLEENAAGDQTGRNVYGINLLTRQAKDDTDTPAYTLTYMYNGHADVTALMDTSGNVVATYYYDAFGNILAQTGTVNNSILYTGYQYEKETGLYYLNARMYDPITARFMQEDTYTGEYNDPLSLNLYTYCKNDPLIYSDPTGHKNYKPGESTAEYYQQKYGGSSKGTTSGVSTTTKNASSTLFPSTESTIAKMQDHYQQQAASTAMSAQAAQTVALTSILTSGSQTQISNTAPYSSRHRSMLNIENAVASQPLSAAAKSAGSNQPSWIDSIPARSSEDFLSSQQNNSSSGKLAFSMAVGASVAIVDDIVISPIVTTLDYGLQKSQRGLFTDQTTSRIISSLQEAQRAMEDDVDSYYLKSGLIDPTFYNQSKNIGHGIAIGAAITSGFFGEIGAVSVTAESAATDIMGGTGNVASERLAFNQVTGKEWENYVEAKQLGPMDAQGLLQTQERFAVDGLGQKSVIPDFSLSDVNGNLSAIGDAKSGAIAYDDQAKGFIQVAANETTSKTVIYYTPTGNTPIPNALSEYAQKFDVKILQVGVK